MTSQTAATTARRTVVVVGGGISGLATAHRLIAALAGHSLSQDAPSLTLIESEPQFGGKIQTLPFGDRPVDLGPDALLIRVPRVLELLGELGLADTVVAPSSPRAFVLHRGDLRPLPAGTVFGVPGRLPPLLRSRLLSPLGLLRAGADLVLPRQPRPADPSVGELLRPRFGDQVFDRLIDPLLGGVHAGLADSLSARSTIAEVEAAARAGRSIYLELRRAARRRAAASGPVLASLSPGLGSLVEALVNGLTPAELLPGQSCVSLERAPDSRGRRYRLTLAGGRAIEAEAVVLATPAPVTAGLLATLAPAAGQALRGIEYAAVANVTLQYQPAAVGRPLDGTGYLVPPRERQLLVGCSWLSSKWPHLAGGPTVLIRGSVGRHGDPRPVPEDDGELISAVHRELAGPLRLTGQPVQAVVRRWPAGLPQYTVGHGARLDTVDRALQEIPGVFVTGAAYRGVGIASCLTGADRAAQAVLDHLSGHRSGLVESGHPR